MSDSVRPQRQQRTRLPRPWDSPGKNAGAGCHFLLQCMKVGSESEVAQSCLTVISILICLFIYSSTHSSIPLIYPSRYPIYHPHLSIYLSPPPMSLSSISLSLSPSIHPPTPRIYPLIYPINHLSIHPPTHQVYLPTFHLLLHPPSVFLCI